MPKSRQRRSKVKSRLVPVAGEMETDGDSASPDAGNVAATPTDAPREEGNGAVEASARNSPMNSPGVEEEANLTTDVVFQCGACRSVLGDTFSEYEVHHESKMVSLKAVRDVTVEDKLQMSNEGFDVGCTYKPIKCSNCQQVLGRVYSSTTPALDSRRATYTFDTTALVSYQLGSCRTMDGQRAEPRKPSAVASVPVPQASRAAIGQDGVSVEVFDALDAHVGSLTALVNKVSNAVAENDDAIAEMRKLVGISGPAISELQSGLENAQNMMLLWEERFRRLESCEQRLEEVSSAGQRLESCEGRVLRIETKLRGVPASPVGQQVGQQVVHRPPARLKVSPSIRRTVPSPAGTPVRRVAPAPAGTPTPAKRRR